MFPVTRVCFLAGVLIMAQHRQNLKEVDWSIVSKLELNKSFSRLSDMSSCLFKNTHNSCLKIAFNRLVLSGILFI